MTRILFLITAEEMYGNQTQETVIGDKNYVMTNTYDANNLLTNISEDSAKDGVNWYVYCGNSPVMYKDPSGNYGEEWANPWYRQQMIWMQGVNALNSLDLTISAEMLHNSIRWFYAEDVKIKDEWNGVEIEGTDRIDGNYLVYTLRNTFTINNEIDWQKKLRSK